MVTICNSDLKLHSLILFVLPMDQILEYLMCDVKAEKSLKVRRSFSAAGSCFQLVVINHALYATCPAPSSIQTKLATSN